jgi:hypothetical protein
MEWQQPEAPKTEWRNEENDPQRVVIRKSGCLWAWEIQTYTMYPWYSEKFGRVWRNRFFDPHGHALTQKAAEKTAAKAAHKAQQQIPYSLPLTSDDK